MKIIDLALKDLSQILRDWKAAVFLLVSPIIFTLFFGFVFSGGGGESDPRLPVGLVDRDQTSLSAALLDLLDDSTVIRVEAGDDLAALERKLAKEDLAALVVIPAGYGAAMQDGAPLTLDVTADPASNAGMSVQNELQGTAQRLSNASRAAQLSVEVLEEQQPFASSAAREQAFAQALEDAIATWQKPPVTLSMRSSALPAAEGEAQLTNSYAHSSPGMMAQFAIAGLIGAAEVIVRERKTRALQRLLTTSISRASILAGHYLSMFIMIFAQFALLIAFGQVFLGLNYAHDWLATLMMALSMAAAAAGMGLLIGVMAKTEEQVIMFTLIPMFILSGLGGAWVPLEVMPETVQKVAHVSPVAWMMDGFQNILVRGLDWRAALLPAGALMAFALGFTLLSILRFRTVSE
ncbi:MAG: ABC transporter permease [Anaerolineaceae bacterium]|nr:ABC transporter permease [Anaerolineaceae bacterium]